MVFCVLNLASPSAGAGAPDDSARQLAKDLLIGREQPKPLHVSLISTTYDAGSFFDEMFEPGGKTVRPHYRRLAERHARERQAEHEVVRGDAAHREDRLCDAVEAEDINQEKIVRRKK